MKNELGRLGITAYAEGDVSLLNRKCVAVVGTRDATDHGKKVAAEISGLLADAGFCIVSGLAVGIDTAAHTGALEHGGATIAVLPSPLDNIMPECNRGLAERIVADGGLLLTEYPSGHPVTEQNYIDRDRIQAALSEAVIVVETDLSSGTMHTARFAREYGKLLACYENVGVYGDSPTIEGNRRLISEGAIRFVDARSILSIINN